MPEHHWPAKTVPLVPHVSINSPKTFQKQNNNKTELEKQYVVRTNIKLQNRFLDLVWLKSRFSESTKQTVYPIVSEKLIVKN